MIPPKPFLGSKPWALILCKFSDHPEEPQPPSFFQDFIKTGSGGINDYFRDVSYGNINLNNSAVFGWFTMPYTLAVDQTRGRWARVMAAIDAVKANVDFRPFYGICVMLNAPVDSGGFTGPASLSLNGATQPYGLVVLDSNGWQNTLAAQEMAHGFSLDHSWAADPDTEYGNPFDVMSAFTNNYGFNHKKFGVSGPGYNAPNLELFGWIPAAKIYDVPRIAYHNSWGLPWGQSRQTLLTFDLDLAALNHKNNSQYICAKIAATSKTFGAFVYYLEYRVADGWDKGLPGNSVVIHQVRSDDKNYLVSPLSGKDHLDVGDTFKDTLNDIQVTFLSEKNSVATLRIQVQITNIYREIVDGPVRVDWHIYERIFERLNSIEKESIVNRQKIIELETRVGQLQGKAITSESVQPMTKSPVKVKRKTKSNR